MYSPLSDSLNPMADSPYTPGMTPMSTPYARYTDGSGRELVNPVSLELMECDTPVNDVEGKDPQGACGMPLQSIGSCSVLTSPAMPGSPSVACQRPNTETVGMVPINAAAYSPPAGGVVGQPMIPAPVAFRQGSNHAAGEQHALPECTSNPTLPNQTSS